jgi:hypothetical protein
VNDIDVSARLHDLDRQLSLPGDAPSAESAITLYHHRRRTRAGLLATMAAVVAIAVGVPTVVSSLSSSGEVAVPSTVAPPSTNAPTPTTASAAPSTPDPADEAELAQVAGALPVFSLTSPEEWDRWLPEGKPFPGTDLEDDLSTCPVLSARLAEVTGQEMSYWSGTLPNGPSGCTWVEIPLSAENNDYDYVISVGFLADGTTTDSFRRYREGPGMGTHACPVADLPAVSAEALLVRCGSSGVTSYTLVLPDARLDGGIWILTVSSKDSTDIRPATILPVLVEGVVATFG